MPDFPPCDDTCGALSEHVRRNFPGQVIEAFTWEAGPIRQQNPHFRALRIEPGRSGVWTYASVGAWAATENQDHGLEFIIAMPVQDPRAVELLAMTAYYHRAASWASATRSPSASRGCPGHGATASWPACPTPGGRNFRRVT
jgi:hypothetical protein